MDRIPDLDLHLAAVAAEEPTLSQLQLDVIREIVYLRRRIDSNEHLARFRSLLDEGGTDLLDSFSTRWLVSIADTFVDFGTGSERGNAMIVVVLANVAKLAETERLILKDATVDPERQRQFVTPGTPLSTAGSGRRTRASHARWRASFRGTPPRHPDR